MDLLLLFFHLCSFVCENSLKLCWHIFSNAFVEKKSLQASIAQIEEQDLQKVWHALVKKVVDKRDDNDIGSLDLP